MMWMLRFGKFCAAAGRTADRSATTATTRKRINIEWFPPSVIVRGSVGAVQRLEAQSLETQSLEVVEPCGVFAHDAFGNVLRRQRREKLVDQRLVGQRAIRRFAVCALLRVVRRRMRPVAAPDATVGRGIEQRRNPFT